MKARCGGIIGFFTLVFLFLINFTNTLFGDICYKILNFMIYPLNSLSRLIFSPIEYYGKGTSQITFIIFASIVWFVLIGKGAEYIIYKIRRKSVEKEPYKFEIKNPRTFLFLLTIPMIFATFSDILALLSLIVGGIILLKKISKEKEKRKTLIIVSIPYVLLFIAIVLNVLNII